MVIEELALQVEGLVLVQGSWLIWEKAMNMDVLAGIKRCGSVILQQGMTPSLGYALSDAGPTPMVWCMLSDLFIWNSLVAFVCCKTTDINILCEGIGVCNNEYRAKVQQQLGFNLMFCSFKITKVHSSGIFFFHYKSFGLSPLLIINLTFFYREKKYTRKC